MSYQPKEPRYRRKPLEWSQNPERPTQWTAKWPFDAGSIRIVLAIHGKYWPPIEIDPDDFDTLDEAKARVEAEITRRLESVLEVCE